MEKITREQTINHFFYYKNSRHDCKYHATCLKSKNQSGSLALWHVVTLWNFLPQDVVDPKSLLGFKEQMDKFAELSVHVY